MAIERKKPNLEEMRQSGPYRELLVRLARSYEMGQDEVAPVLDSAILGLLSSRLTDHIYSLAEGDARGELDKIKRPRSYSNQEQV